jgi:hypothetical protein
MLNRKAIPRSLQSLGGVVKWGERRVAEPVAHSEQEFHARTEEETNRSIGICKTALFKLFGQDVLSRD